MKMTGREPPRACQAEERLRAERRVSALGLFRCVWEEKVKGGVSYILCPLCSCVSHRFFLANKQNARITTRCEIFRGDAFSKKYAVSFVAHVFYPQIIKWVKFCYGAAIKDLDNAQTKHAHTQNTQIITLPLSLDDGLALLSHDPRNFVNTLPTKTTSEGRNIVANLPPLQLIDSSPRTICFLLSLGLLLQG